PTLFRPRRPAGPALAEFVPPYRVRSGPGTNSTQAHELGAGGGEVWGLAARRGPGRAPPETANGPPGRAVLVVAGEGFEPPKHSAADLQSAPFGHSGNPPGSRTTGWKDSKP